MYPLVSISLNTTYLFKFPANSFISRSSNIKFIGFSRRKERVKFFVNSNNLDTSSTVEEGELKTEETEEVKSTKEEINTRGIDKDLKKVVQKTAATFAPRASTKSKNPAVPGTVLYTVFEVQAYASMLLGGVLSFNLLFPSNEPDIWRLMGMWSIWMFTIPSLRARDCSKDEKEALNYLFILVPLLNVLIPFFWKSFAVVWSADTVAFFGMYAWKMGWLQEKDVKS
ncbi:Resistance to phytophthora 1 protein [Thalictrum thalictroides]|uniref:Resistance to phytophthora 1 protein n=1 Tax=Thalictrum thalictroides TaxID=46969 RepID=A0A7J6WS41_THATH|nr:Resistance to phytophthora 1 protein [Thalictrum thalictroides]